MLSIVGKKFYVFWATLLVVFPAIIHSIWLKALYSTETREEAIATFIGYFPALFQFTSFLAFISLFLSTLSFMFSIRLIKELDKYLIPGIILSLISIYLLSINIWYLI